MLDIREHFWYWAFRYRDNEEPAILVAMQSPTNIHRADIHRLIRRNKLVDAKRQIETDQISASDWKTWHAFDLCPTIEVYIVSDENNELAYEVIES